MSVIVRFIQLRTRTPMLVLEAAVGTTMGALKVMVEARMAEEDTMLMRVATKWHPQAQIGDTKRFVDMTASDLGTSMSSLGIENYSEVGLEGPLIDSVDGAGKAIALLNLQCQRMQSEMALLQAQMKFVMAALPPNAALSKHPGMPMKALWEALNDTALVGPEVAMAIVNDPRCGIERRSEVREGWMHNKAQGFALNWREGGATPLILAALAGRDDVIEALLSLNAAVDTKEDTFGYTALHVSARTNNISAIELLLAKGGDVKAVTDENNAALHCAAESGKPVAKCSDVKAVDLNGYTPLHLAACNGNIEAIKLLIAKGGNVKAVTDERLTALHCAARSAKPKAIELLISMGSDVKAVAYEGWTALHFAANNGKLEAIELLIAKGSDVKAIDEHGYTPLLVAVRSGNTISKLEAIDLLIAHGSDVSAVAYDGWTALHCAANNGKPEDIELLIAKGADVMDVDEQGYTPLLVAARSGNNEAIEQLIAKGSDVRAVAYDGWTSLHYTASYGKPEAIGLLIAKGSDVRAVTADGSTPLNVFERNQPWVRVISDEKLIRAMLAC